MTCTDTTIKEQLPAFARGALDKADKLRMETHLGSCEDCRSELSILVLMVEDEVPDPGTEFWDSVPSGVLRAMRRAQEHTTGRRTGLLDWFMIPRLAWSAAAASAVIVVLTWLAINPVPPEMVKLSGPIAASSGEEDLPAQPVNLSEASPDELTTVTQWAQNQLEPISEAIDQVRQDADYSFSDDLTTLTDDQMARLSGMLRKKEQEMKEKQQKSRNSKVVG